MTVKGDYLGGNQQKEEGGKKDVMSLMKYNICMYKNSLTKPTKN
jgi:hypothetical protein